MFGNGAKESVSMEKRKKFRKQFELQELYFLSAVLNGAKWKISFAWISAHKICVEKRSLSHIQVINGLSRFISSKLVEYFISVNIHILLDYGTASRNVRTNCIKIRTIFIVTR